MVTGLAEENTPSGHRRVEEEAEQVVFSLNMVAERRNIYLFRLNQGPTTP